MVKITLIPQTEFRRVQQASLEKTKKLTLLADMCRANTMASVKMAGSGHLGSSFSSLDIVTMLYYDELNCASLDNRDPSRDIYFSSKGHDVPGQYAVLHSLDRLPSKQFMMLRKLGGTFGHPDISIPGIEANTGSLGMGISKGKGMAFAKHLLNYQGRIFVMTGDGELQEGQIYEALQSAVQQKINNLNVIIDHNKVQTDRLVQDIVNLGNLENKLRSFGWHVERCDGHNFSELEAAFNSMRAVNDRPKILIADTIKGKGISFMEHPQDMKNEKGLYHWHSGAPNDESFRLGYEEIITRIDNLLAECSLTPLEFEDVPQNEKKGGSVSSEKVADAYGKALVELGGKRPDLVVLDADLSSDCRTRDFEYAFPERFMENGIAEQDMVSTAGGLALQGLLPVCNSFAAFLASRANEQIYTNSCERTKIIYALHYAGLIPAGPGQSHQSIRDISLFGALPGFTVLQPCNAEETRMAMEYCVNEAPGSCALRLIIGPSPRLIELPGDYRFTPGKGVSLTEGRDAVMFAYGPVMLHEALLASELLEADGFSLQVVNMPWLNQLDANWLSEVVSQTSLVGVLEDHSPVGGLGSYLLPEMTKLGLMAGRRFFHFGVEGYPACGTPAEVLRHHRLDGESLARRLLETAREK